MRMETDVYDKALRIIETYFDGEDEEVDYDVEPDMDDSAQQFAFGTDGSNAGGHIFNFNH